LIETEKIRLLLKIIQTYRNLYRYHCEPIQFLKKNSALLLPSIKSAN